MKRYRLYILAIFAFPLLIAGCSKSDFIDSKERAELLINKKWQLVVLTTKSNNGQTVVNSYDSLPAFRKDDYLLLRPDSTYEYNDNMELRPGGSSKILDAGEWKLIRENRTLELFSTFYTKTYPPFDIIALTQTKLEMETKSQGDGSVVRMTFVEMK